MRQTAFELYHPIIQMAFFVSAIAFVMFAFQPIYLVLGVLCDISYELLLVGAAATLRSASWQLPLVLIVCLMNPLFFASGSTLLFSVGSLRVYAESLAYGACLGLMIVGVICWFTCAARVISVDKVMGVLGNAVPVVALMVSMVLRLVPAFLRRGKEIDGVQRACTANSSSANALRVVQSKARVSTVLVGWALEDSFELADSMRSRGWGCGRRSTYQRARFRTRDVGALVVLGLAVMVNTWLAWVACADFSFYPTMTRLAVWWNGYIPYVMFLLAPIVLEGVERFAEERRS